MNPDYVPDHSEEQPMKDNADAPKDEFPARAGFVIYDPRAMQYLLSTAVFRGLWSERASEAHIYEKRELAETILRRYSADRPEAFVHPVTPGGPSPNMPGAA